MALLGRIKKVKDGLFSLFSYYVGYMGVGCVKIKLVRAFHRNIVKPLCRLCRRKRSPC